MLLVFTDNNLISPRPFELTPDQLLIDISCHLISPCFLFAHSSYLISFKIYVTISGLWWGMAA